jgi:hypothetical protein
MYMYVCENVFNGNFKTCSHQCHTIQATAVRFQNLAVIVRDEQNAEGLFGPKKKRKQQNVEVKNNTCS